MKRRNHMYSVMTKEKMTDKSATLKISPSVKSNNTEDAGVYLSVQMTREISKSMHKLTNEMIRNIMEGLIGE